MQAVRAGRSARYGHLTCGSCTEAERDEFRCCLAGHEREPAPVPTYRLDMGPTRRAVLTRQCPVGLALRDPQVGLWLTAYGMVRRWGKWPPGRDDPRVLEAMVVIQREHDLIDREQAAV
ncbi:MAG TPA: hypothetical protein VFW98_08330 [Gemmatimonadaceae bacterium]|nr:hypothetical protein [Gemmatimonadaceae bacterium]